MSTSFTASWLAGDPEALALLPRFHAERAVAVASTRRVHPQVLDAIDAQTPAQRAQKQRLAQGAVCVVTGQQAGLFGGPLYTVYKTASAIVNARALEARTGVPCVPVFWLQNEDHDYDEISECVVLAGGDLRRICVPGRAEDAGRSVAARTLGPTVDEALAAVEDALHGLSEADQAIGLLKRCWTADRSPDQAFKQWLEALFAPHGLLIVDPSDPRLVEAARPVHLKALRDAEALSACLLERTVALEAAGFSAQVHVRPGAPLSFYHPEGPRGPRIRIARAEEAPEDGHFSTSALLRPILQDTWLPTACTVGGPGEVAYFAQLPPLYEAFGLPPPSIVLRARFRVVDETTARLLDQLALSPDALAAPRDELLRQIGRPRDGHPDPDEFLARLTAPLQDAFADFAPHAHTLGLAKPADKTRASMTDAATRLVDRYRRALALQDEVTVGRLDRLLARLQPGGAPQERVHAWPWYGARYGVEGFVSAVLSATVPFEGALTELSP